MFDFFTILHDNGLLLLMGQYPDGPLGGVLCTLLVSLLAVLFAFPVGVLLCLARLSPWRWLSWPVTCWIYLATRYSSDDGGVLDLFLRAVADWPQY